LGFHFTDVEGTAIDSEISRIVSEIRLVDDDEEEDLEKMNESSSDASDFFNPDDVDKMRRYLEDTVSLLQVVNEESEGEEGAAPTDTEPLTDDEGDDVGFQ